MGEKFNSTRFQVFVVSVIALAAKEFFDIEVNQETLLSVVALIVGWIWADTKRPTPTRFLSPEARAKGGGQS